MNKLHWERVHTEPEHSGYLYRARVEGGWLYKQIEDVPVDRNGAFEFGLQWSSSLCFVPDLPAQ